MTQKVNKRPTSSRPPDLCKRSSSILHIQIPSSIHQTGGPTVDRTDVDSGPPLVSGGGRHQAVGGRFLWLLCVARCGLRGWDLFGHVPCDACDIAGSAVQFSRITKEFVQIIIVLWFFFFFWFILLIILFGTAEPHTIFVLQLLYSKFKLRCVTGFVDSPLCAGVSGSFFFFFFFCLRVFFVSVSGSGTSKWAGDLYLTPCAKMCFACWLFPPSSFASSSAMFSSFMSLFVYIHSGWKSQTQKDAARNKAFLRPFLPLLFPSLKCRRSGHAWGFQTSVCVGGLWRATPP